MKRAFPQKFKSASCHPFIVDVVVGQARRTLPGVNRRARTSAAMIGLALSMGASSLLLPRQDDGAAAAEPRTAESAVVATSVEHIVQSGQTLWQIAQRYGVSAEAIAASNGIATDSTLQVGQTLRVPASDSRSSSGVASERIAPEATAPESIPTFRAASPNSRLNRLEVPAESLDDSLKAEQDIALERLHQQRERLRSSLAELRSEELQNSVDPEEVKPSIQSSEEAVAPISPVVEPTLPLAAPIEPTPSESVRLSTYQVKSGDTLDAIARAYGITRRELAEVNQLTDPNWLQVNQSLAIPQSEPIALASPVPDSIPTVNSSSSDLPATLVQPESVTVQPEIQLQPEIASLETPLTVHQVNSGDTLSEIARIYGISRSELANANRLSNPNMIFVGQELDIPTNSGLEASAEEVAVPGATVSVPTVTAPANVLPDQLVSESDAAIVTVPTVPTPVLIASSESSAPLPAVRMIPSAGSASELAPSEQVAVTPNNIPPAEEAIGATEVASAPSGTSPYVQNLMTEIRSLRDRYQSEMAEAEQPALVATAPTGTPSSLVELPNPSSDINPEFSPDRYTEAFQAEIRRLQEERRNQVAQVPVQSGNSASGQSAEVVSLPSSESEPQTEEQLVAVAPLGSENYQPLTQPITGRMVSPDLPPLPGAEAYLPDGAASFSGYLWPARGVLTSGYGWRWGRMHRGIDIGAPTGTPVVAAAPGVVEFSGWNSGGYGNMVEIRHADGSMTRYAHHSRNLVRAGQEVDQGQQIAEVGSTGYSTGPHLHFEVHLPNQGTVNPIAYLPR
ncbi:MAG: LysM peptidoglycan-binding domain-containing protein [Leptolyngbyaceae cyanobacterium SM1_4_3]|nr:LysM peptidoglycan-binding domain-containing protein [Leptolyngbyaceae cyanobacterium SM1_4_3]NJN89487.1 LysM peptidoglycan-binding domain-containing protein [Leptolyngbyaceae cyanobacterium SL_5_14]